MMIDFKNKQVRKLAINGGISFLSLCTFGWLSYAAHSDTEAARVETEGIRGQITAAETEIRQIPKLEERVLALRERVRSDVAILPDDAEVHAFVKKLTDFAGEAGVTIDKLDDAAVRQRSNNKKSREAFDRIVYKLDLSATGPELIAFFDLFENEYERFVRITNFKINSDDRAMARLEEEPDYKPQHHVNMELETYVYNPKRKGGNEVAIPDADAKLAKLIESGQLERRVEPLSVERYDYTPRPDRRDPFVDPRYALAKSRLETEQQVAREGELLAKLEEEWEDVEALLKEEAKIENHIRKLQAQEKTDQALRSFGALVDEHALRGTIVTPEGMAQFRSKYQAPLDKLRDERQLASAGQGQRLANELSAQLSHMRESLAEGAFQDVVEVAKTVEPLRERAEDLAELRDLWVAIDALSHRAGVEIEFSSLSLKVGGLVVYPDRRRAAVVIINGKAYSPDEQISDGLRLIDVQQESLLFEFRGVEVRRNLKGT